MKFIGLGARAFQGCERVRISVLYSFIAFHPPHPLNTVPYTAGLNDPLFPFSSPNPFKLESVQGLTRDQVVFGGLAQSFNILF